MFPTYGVKNTEYTPEYKNELMNIYLINYHIVIVFMHLFPMTNVDFINKHSSIERLRHHSFWLFYRQSKHI